MRRDSVHSKTNKKFTASFDLSCFEVHRLRTSDGVERALSELENVLYRCDTDSLIVSLLSKPQLFEFVISVSREETSAFICKFVLDRFPSTSIDFSSSLSSQLLSRLALFLLFLPYPSREEIPANLKECHQSFQFATRALAAISSLKYDGDFGVVSKSNDDDDDSETLKVSCSKIKQTQRRKKQARKASRAAVFDPTPFESIGVDIPQTPEQARDLTAKILQDQRGVLQFYFDVLRRPYLSDLIMRAYVPRDPSTILQSPQTENPVDVITTESQLSLNTTPSAYPMVQPMRAALYFESAEGFGHWRVLISTRADRDLREARKHGKPFDIILKKIIELSNGHFSEDNQKRLNGSDKDVPIFEAKMSRDLRLVYQIDCVPEFDSAVERQVLRIFGIYTHAQLDKRLWDSMGCQLAKRGRDYRQRCIFRNKTRNNAILPASFPPQADTSPTETHHAEPRKEDLDELHLLLVLEKFVVFSQALLNSIVADQDAVHVFAVSPQEQQIIEHSSSCYVLGRSGTGKTTTMLFKMLAIEKSCSEFKGLDKKPRQLFVTQSRVLAGRVEEYFSKLLESLVAASKSPLELAALTKRKIDHHGQELLDIDDDQNWRSDLPERFSLLEDKHFPLFLTFEHLCEMIEKDFDLSFSRLPRTKEHRRIERRIVLADLHSNDVLVEDISKNGQTQVSAFTGKGRQNPASHVSYYVFRKSYWPHFPQSLVKGLDPALVFSEFMGVIEGSEHALYADGGHLDRRAYNALSHRSQATFSTQRDNIYNLFQHYLKKKREYSDYDAADRTLAILHDLEARGMPGQKIDFLYVDEVQDNLLIDARLLRWICGNPGGLFWAGDTAQTISVGSSFRFNELKAFLHRVEEKECLVESMRRSPIQPQLFQLSVNYRSHGGIVNCASSVIELIAHFWPNSIDILAKEKGVIDGLKPVFFTNWDQDTVRYEQFLFGETGSSIEFGAQQCILVRTDAARDRLRKQVGEVGMIMTLYESKGLEFNDVLLYNFFEDSTLDLSQWRVVLNLTEKNTVPPPVFDEIRHAGVCSELKCLYVAITRARRNMWIVDRSEKCEPMRAFWTSRYQVENCTPGTDVPHLAVSSSPEEWANTGRSLFHNKRYPQAMHCFERAGLHHEKAVAHAYYLREQARTAPSGHRNEAARAFIIAAVAFVSCSTGASASSVRQAYLRNAGECYVRGEDIPAAARAYLDASEYTLSAQYFRKAGMFGDAVQVIKDHKASMQLDVAESIIDVARIFYLKEHNLRQAADLFSSEDEALAFAGDYDLDVARAALLENMGRRIDAAELHLAEGRPTDAMRLFLADREDEYSMRRAGQCLLESLWRTLSFGVVPSNDGIYQSLTDLIGQLNIALLRNDQRDEISVFRAILSNDQEALRTLGRTLGHAKDNIASLLSFDHVFRDPPRIRVATSLDVTSYLEDFLMYSRLLQKISSHSDPSNDSGIQKLFGFQISVAERAVLLPTGTHLHFACATGRFSVIKSDDNGILTSSRELAHLFRDSLVERLKSRIVDETDAFRRATVVSTCLQFAVSGFCNSSDCSREHLKPGDFDRKWYNARIRLRLQQILILQTLYSISPGRAGPDRLQQQLFWLLNLYEAFNPPYFGHGNFVHLSLDLIPEAHKAFQVISGWLRGLFYVLDVHYLRVHTVTFLSAILRLAALSFAIDKPAARDYIGTSPAVGLRPATLLRKPANYIVHDLICSLEGREPQYLSAGLLFLHHVLINRQPIDVTALCHMMDYVFGIAIMHDRLRQKSLHDVTLPKTWILSILRTLQPSESIYLDANILRRIFQPIGDLLELLYIGHTDHLLFETGSRMGAQVRNVFIARICRALCLLGYNIRDWSFRNRILSTITSLRREGRRFSHLYAKYVEARQWDHLARAVRQSTLGWALDEMIQLHLESRTSPVPPPHGVRRVVFKNLEEIPWLLNSSGLVMMSNLSATAAPFVPSHISIPSAVDQPVEPPSEYDADMILTDNESDGGPPDSSVEIEGTPVQGEVSVDDILLPVEGGWSHASSSRSWSDDEIRAARVFEAHYHRVIRHKRVNAGASSGLQHARSLSFATFRAESQTMDWPNKYYRLLFLGPIPHLMVCVDQMHAQIHSLKAKTKKKLLTLEHGELENLQSEMTRNKELFDTINRLKKELQPSSPLHRQRDIEGLKTLVLDVAALIRQIPEIDAKDFNDDFALSMKAIVQTRRIAKKVKPELNVDDLADLM